jgi:hypothetical protein
MFSLYDNEPASSFIVHPSMLHSSESSRRPSLSPQQVRSGPKRQRTPIQHHQRDLPRSRSQSRSEALMTYVTDQIHSNAFDLQSHQPSLTVIPSQSAPTTPQILPGPSYSDVQEGSHVPVTTVHDYFAGSLTAPHLNQMPDFSFQAEPGYQDYYPLSRVASLNPSASSGMNPQESYLPHGGHHGTDAFHGGGDQLPMIGSLPATLASSGTDFEIMPSRPKPQCWEHGCNGRQFSTFSNLLRHQREKSGSAMKAICPYCGTEFTRTTARNGHMYGGKCKGRGDEDSTVSESGAEKEPS